MEQVGESSFSTGRDGPPSLDGQHESQAHFSRRRQRTPLEPVDEGGNNEMEDEPIRYRFLKDREYIRLARAVGGIRCNPKPADVECASHKGIVLNHPTSSWWPTKGMTPGLYRDVVECRARFYSLFHFISMVRWTLIVTQVSLGAILTALGAMAQTMGTEITVLAACNTFNAGVLALLHNSGLPERHRSDMNEFIEVEDHIKMLLNSGLVPLDMELSQAISDCFDKFMDAKATVNQNVPNTYTASAFVRSMRNRAGDRSRRQRPPLVANSMSISPPLGLDGASTHRLTAVALSNSDQKGKRTPP